jgi:hypothetical protein
MKYFPRYFWHFERNKTISLSIFFVGISLENLNNDGKTVIVEKLWGLLNTSSIFFGGEQ